MSGRNYGPLPRGTAKLLVAAVVVLATVAGSLAVGAVASSDPDVGDTRENAADLPVNSSTNGTLESRNDTDWYAVQVERSERLLVLHLALPDGYDTDGYGEKAINFTVVGPDGEELSSVDSDTHNNRPAGTAVRVAEPGTYYVRLAEAYDDSANGSQGYRMEATSYKWDANEPNDEESSATQFDGDLSVSTQKFGRDKDYYATHLEEGENVTVTWAYDEINGDNLYELSVVGPSGHVTDVGHPEGQSSGERECANFTAPESGTYFFVIRFSENSEGSFYVGSEGILYDVTVETGAAQGGERTDTPAGTLTDGSTDTPTGTPTDTPDDDSRASGSVTRSPSDDARYSPTATQTTSSPATTTAPGQSTSTDETSRSTTTTTSTAQPGYRVVAALVAILGGTCLALRRR